MKKFYETWHRSVKKIKGKQKVMSKFDSTNDGPSGKFEKKEQGQML
jgi:hypothetical protein